MNQRTSTLLVVLALIASCNDSKQQQATTFTDTAIRPMPVTLPVLRQAEWLLGNWGGATAEGVIYESWAVQNDSTFAGTGLFLIRNDTVSREQLILRQSGNMLYYVPTVNNQNDGKPVVFTSTAISPDSLIFENAAHDYPQKIAYYKSGSDSILAVISGMQKGKYHREDFPLRRRK